MSTQVDHLECRMRWVCGLVSLIGAVCVFLVPIDVRAETYKPMFEPALLKTLDPATRERFQALETENRKRWKNKNPVGSRSGFARAEALKHHQETEQALRRIEESNRLKQRLEASKQHQANLVTQHNRRCAQLAREIEQLVKGGPIYELDQHGARQYLSEQELKKRVKSSEKRYKEGCTG